jgi:hypothetical protein
MNVLLKGRAMINHFLDWGSQEGCCDANSEPDSHLSTLFYELDNLKN